ncbi:MAG: hypothetical protein JNL74_16705 [Fibrobacteres bacterium]|nr:hypothetical protein [Fibrobacterota bacterium]
MKYTVTVLLILSLKLFAYNNIDSLFSLPEKKITYCTVLPTAPATYLGSTFLTVELPFEDVVTAMQDFDYITKSIGIIRVFKKIPGKELYDFEAKIGIARGWALLKLDSMVVDSNKNFYLVFRGDDSPALINVWKEQHKGFFVARGNAFYLRFKFKKLSSTQTRLSYISTLQPEYYVPHWLFVLASDFAIPSVLRDIEKAIKIRPTHQ